MENNPEFLNFSQDTEFLNLIHTLKQVAGYPVAILLQGESGSGKGMLARMVHKCSIWEKGPFVSINCAAIPEGLLESELFGHERGAFTGAIRQVPGKIECAAGGTLFLDEIGDLPLSLQPKLLSFLETKIIERVGGRESIRVPVRIIAATHQPLEQLMMQGRFRSDLYYRLGEISFRVPALRARGGDVVWLAQQFLKNYAQDLSIKIKSLSHEALLALEQHHWPGNVRELQNRIKRALILSHTPFIEPKDLDLTFETSSFAKMQLKTVREEAERQALVRALVYTEHNVARAAELLGVTRPTLYHLLARHQLEPMSCSN